MWHAWERKVYRDFVGKADGKRSLGRPRLRWEDGIRMVLRETGWWSVGVDPVGSGQGPVAGSCEYGDEPSGSGATELVSYRHYTFLSATFRNPCYPRLVVHVGGVRLSLNCDHRPGLLCFPEMM
jgi:hypothetical protein